MDKSLLVTRPNHDYTTIWLFHWAEGLIGEALRRKITVVDLAGQKAILTELEGRLRKISPDFIVLNGHGDAGTVTGQDNQPLISAGQNELLLAGSVVYAISCDSAKELGPAAVKSGTKAYIGYTEEFVFFIDESLVSNPTNDQTAKLFLDPAYSVALSLVKGHSASAAHTKATEMYKKTIRELLISDRKSENYLLPFLLANLNRLVCLGDGQAII
ncbi:MAG: hypothetical protein NUV80_00020 [Candidatus Berkelbacteria bacterium]|nr:hypothetical protein [Candidatus Berkelbacteria bacterium]MCR4306937.1 hypothetical protein [Candidatus Berkelbacteria bacterium]